jgi:hypothetical protein
MKTKLLLLVVLLMANVVYSQVIDVITNFNGAGIVNIAHKDNYIYFTSYSQKRIYKFDHTAAVPAVEIVHQFTENPNFIYTHDNFLYVGTENTYKTYRIDLSSSVVQPIVIANIAGPMAQIGNKLYIGQYVAEKISTIDLTTLVKTDILTNYKPNFFALHNNELYFTSNTTNKLYKYNNTTNDVAIIMSNLNYASGIVLNSQNLFICESSSSTITYYSLPNFEYVSNIQLPANSWPNGITIVNDHLYFVQTITGKISKVALNSITNYTLSDTFFEDTKEESLAIYPNPSEGVFNIKSETLLEKGEVYDASGKLVMNLKISNNQFDLSALNSGNYLFVADGETRQLIKK